MTMEQRIPTRLGDGSPTALTRSEMRADIEAGTEAAVKRAHVAPLTADDTEHLLDICASRARFSSVDVGSEVVLSIDGTGGQLIGSRQCDLQTFEQYLGADVVELYHMDYSFKAVKTVLPFEQQTLKNAQQALTVPVQYGAMPDLGRYSQPDGPIPNWSELLPDGRLVEARAAQEEASALASRDISYVAEGMWKAGADAIDLDTSGAAGDADFKAALDATREIRRRCPDLGIEMGMASEMVLGMHGELEWEGVRLAGLWPHQQMRLAAAAGATVFGPAVNVNSSKSLPWNLARALTLVKPCSAEATIPIHMNVGMGVGGVPMAVRAPVDAVSRAARACVEILHLDGL
jgi:dimethylamine---corrinoid protein Co-methyltransferase